MKKLRIKKGICLGVDPGTNGALVQVNNGKILRYFPFCDRHHTVGINSVAVLDPQWLYATLSELKKECETITIESPRVCTHSGNVRIQIVVKLHQQISQIYSFATLLGFEVVLADPQNWQGYHGIAKSGTKKVQQVYTEMFKQWHSENNPSHPALKLSKAKLEGVAAAWFIAQYEYQEPIVKERKELLKIQQPTIDREFIMF